MHVALAIDDFKRQAVAASFQRRIRRIGPVAIFFHFNRTYHFAVIAYQDSHAWGIDKAGKGWRGVIGGRATVEPAATSFIVAHVHDFRRQRHRCNHRQLKPGTGE